MSGTILIKLIGLSEYWEWGPRRPITSKTTQFKMAFKMVAKTSKSFIFLRTINAREVNSVSRIWFSWSRNPPSNIILDINWHYMISVTFIRSKSTAQKGQSSRSWEPWVIERCFWCLLGFRGQGIHINYIQYTLLTILKYRNTDHLGKKFPRYW